MVRTELQSSVVIAISCSLCCRFVNPAPGRVSVHCPSLEDHFILESTGRPRRIHGFSHSDPASFDQNQPAWPSWHRNLRQTLPHPRSETHKTQNEPPDLHHSSHAMRLQRRMQTVHPAGEHPATTGRIFRVPLPVPLLEQLGKLPLSHSRSGVNSNLNATSGPASTETLVHV